MSRHLLLATARGLWWLPLEQEASPRPDDFHRAAPDAEITALAAGSVPADAAKGSPAPAAALDAEGGLLLWDRAAAGFREAEPLPIDDETQWEVLASTSGGGLWAGACPARIAAYDPTGDAWEFHDLPSTSSKRAWTGLEAPYLPRITSFLAEGGEDWAAVSAGGLLRRRRSRWEEVALAGMPRDLRDLATAFGARWVGSGRGLFRWDDEGGPQRVELAPEASFTARLRAGRKKLAVAAACGPPATWRGPEGARASLWIVDGRQVCPRWLAGPFHGGIVALDFHREDLLVGTTDGEVWTIPLAGDPPAEPWIFDLPPVNDLLVIDLPAGGG